MNPHPSIEGRITMCHNDPVLAGREGDPWRSLTPAARALLCELLARAVAHYESTVSDLRGSARNSTIGHIRQMRDLIAVFGGSYGRR
jgi:hypothetical protein